MGKRTVALTVKPRGEIRWNLDGTNVKEGKLYAGPIDIPGEGEATIYAYAEDAGVSVSEELHHPPGDRRQGDHRSRQAGDGRQEDEARDDRGHVRHDPRRQEEQGHLRQRRRRHGRQGRQERHHPLRARDDLAPDAIEAFISAARTAIGDEAADVEFTFGEFKFASGADLTEFLQETSEQIKVDPDRGPAVSEKKTIGFGVPNEMDPHHFTVEIPAARTEPVVITEHFGLRGGTNGLPDSIVRCRLPRAAWTGIAEEAKRVLNERLKEKKLSTSRWSSGTNKSSACWVGNCASSHGASRRRRRNSSPTPSATGSALRPDERWWLFSMAAAMTGGEDDGDIGWRKAIRIALTENPTGEEVAEIRPQGKGQSQSQGRAPAASAIRRLIGEGMDAVVSKSPVTPFSLKDAPSLIERVWPAQKISVEAQKERKAGSAKP